MSCSVILIGNYLPDRQESMLRFEAVLERELRREGVEVKTIRPSATFGRFKTGLRGLDKWIGYVDKFIIFPFVLRRMVRAVSASPVIFHICDHSNAMYGAWLRGHWLITCHDLLAIQSALGEIPENPTRMTGRVLQSWILSSLRKAQQVACVSQSTSDHLVRLARIPKERARVIRLGLNEPFVQLDPAARDKILGPLFKSRGMDLPARYLFHVGGNQWYKNRRGLIEIFARVASSAADLKLVFAGQSLTTDLTELVLEKGLGHRVLDIGEVSHPELNALYAGAEALVFPSLAEGFGWPLIEAQASGCPVITSDRPPMNEIINDSAILIDPLAFDETAQKIVNFLGWILQERKDLIDRGLANSTRFQTKRMIEEYLGFYRDILASKSEDAR